MPQIEFGRRKFLRLMRDGLLTAGLTATIRPASPAYGQDISAPAGIIDRSALDKGLEDGQPLETNVTAPKEAVAVAGIIKEYSFDSEGELADFELLFPGSVSTIREGQLFLTRTPAAGNRRAVLSHKFISFESNSEFGVRAAIVDRGNLSLVLLQPDYGNTFANFRPSAGEFEVTFQSGSGGLESYQPWRKENSINTGYGNFSDYSWRVKDGAAVLVVNGTEVWRKPDHPGIKTIPTLSVGGPDPNATQNAAFERLFIASL